MTIMSRPNRTEHSQKSLHFNKWSIRDHETRTYDNETRTSWGRGRDRDRDQKSGLETLTSLLRMHVTLRYVTDRHVRINGTLWFLTLRYVTWGWKTGFRLPKTPRTEITEGNQDVPRRGTHVPDRRVVLQRPPGHVKSISHGVSSALSLPHVLHLPGHVTSVSGTNGQS